MKKTTLQSTSYPFLLYFMRDDKAELTVEDEKVNIYYNNQKVKYETMSWLFIFLLKHALPIWFIWAIFDTSVFKAIDNWFVPVVIMLFIIPATWIFKNKRHFIIFYFVIILTSMYFVATRASHLVNDINYSFTVDALLFFSLFLIYDMYVTYKRFKYYYIKDVALNVKYKLGNKKFTIGFWKLKKTFVFSKKRTTLANFNLTGTFVKVPNSIDWSKK